MDDERQSNDIKFPRFSISATIAAVWVVIIASVAVAVCTLATSIVFSTNSLREVAQGSARASFAHCNDRVVTYLNYPRAAGHTQQLYATSALLPAVVPVVDTWNESNWYIPWKNMHINMLANSDFNLLFSVTGFEDGQYTGCQTYSDNLTIFSCLYNNPVLDADPILGTHTKRVNYSRADGSVLTTEVDIRILYDVRVRPWFINTNASRTKGTWSDVTFSSVPSYPVIAYNSAVYGRTNNFLGISTFQLELSRIDGTFSSLLKGQVQKAFLLDNKNLLIASSLDRPAFERRTIPSDYVLTAADISQNCVRSDPTIRTLTSMVCQYSVDRFDNPALTGIRNQWSDQFDNDYGSPERTGLLTIHGDTYYGMVSRLKGLGADTDNMKWKLVVSLKENDAMPALLLGRNLAIGIGSAVVVILALLVSVGLRFLLRPLTAVADLMGTAAYFTNEDFDSDSSGYGHDVCQKEEARKAHAALTKNRMTSYLREVATIQQAYWVMSDELQRLKSYLPEHLLHEMTTINKKEPGPAAALPHEDHKNSAFKSPGDVASLGSNGQPKFTDVGPLTAQTLQRFSELDTNAKVALNWTTHPPSDIAAENKFSPTSPLAASSTSGSLPKEQPADVIGGTENATGTRSSSSGLQASDSNPTLFGNRVLTDREVSIAIVNIVQFHRYTQGKLKAEITKEHADVVKLVYSTARRCGGVLETFMGDKFYVSFNSTSKCQHHAVAATCFALEVSNVINKEALAAQHRTVTRKGTSDAPAGLPPLGRIKSLFSAAPCGVTCGVSTGHALVGPMGTNNIRRHTIISNAVTEAVALERMAIRYPNCSVFIGGDSIPAVEGYCQYLLLDATLLPASGGMRRRIASVKSAMCAEGCSPDALCGLSDLAEARLRRHSPYETINRAFNAFLEGRAADSAEAVRRAMQLIRGEVHSQDAPIVSREQGADINMMCELLSSFMASRLDGRVYRATVGDQYGPIDERILLDFSSPRNPNDGSHHNQSNR